MNLKNWFLNEMSRKRHEIKKAPRYSFFKSKYVRGARKGISDYILRRTCLNLCSSIHFIYQIFFEKISTVDNLLLIVTMTAQRSKL
jgi:hypothetical protein